MEERDLKDNGIRLALGANEMKEHAQEILRNLKLRALNKGCEVAPSLVGHLAFKAFTTPRPREVKLRGPFQHAELSYLGHNEKRVALYRMGEDPEVLLIHGWQGMATDLHPFARELTDKGKGVIAFDAPAHGQSTGKSTNAVEVATIISEILQRYPSIKTIVAHSFGGFASSIAIRDYATGSLERLVLIGAPDRLEDVVQDYVKDQGLGQKFKVVLMDHIVQRFKRESSELSVASLLTGTDVEVHVVHDYLDFVCPIGWAKSIVEGAGGKAFFTKGQGHLKILRDPEVLKYCCEVAGA